MEHDQEGEEPVRDATPIIAWLLDMGWEPDADKIERLREVVRNREPTKQPRGVSWRYRKGDR